MERTQGTIIVGTATITDETGLQYMGVVVASDLGDAVFHVGTNSSIVAEAIADDLVEKLQIVVGGNVERGEVD